MDFLWYISLSFIMKIFNYINLLFYELVYLEIMLKVYMWGFFDFFGNRFDFVYEKV